MYLKSLELQGFKSFADKVTLDFVKGITSIVGPNGSGKSNISDAMRWVMGEQSAKTLRGSKMEDVIFSGTELRKAVGFCQVSLTLDNSDKVLPLEFDEITVTRKVYRSGESEYYINKSLCRLKDINEIFMDTGLGKDGYSIIGQGRIGEILSTKSEDRRLVFEEAAGITKYRYRKDEAEKKLHLTNENLLRLRDITIELESQLTPLKQQSDNAKRALILRDRLKDLEINVMLRNIDTLREDAGYINEQWEELCNGLQQDQADLKNMEQECDNLYKQLKVLEGKTDRFKMEQYQNTSAIQQYSNEVQILQNDIRNNENNKQSAQTALELLKQKEGQQQQQLIDKNTHLQLAREDEQRLSAAIERMMLENQQTLEDIEQAGTSISIIKTDLSAKNNVLAEKKINLNGLTVSYKNTAERIDIIQKELEAKQLSIEQTTAIKQNTLDQLSENESNLKQSTADSAKLAKQLTDMEQDLRLQKDKHDRLIISYKEKVSRKKMLKDMENEYEGYGKSVKTVMQAHKTGALKNLNIHGTLTQIITVPGEFVTAIEASLGSALQNIVVEDELDGKECINFLKSNNSGRATFLPISSVSGRKLDNISGEGYIGTASELIQYDSRYAGIINSLLGRVAVVRNIDFGISLARRYKSSFRIVTLSGDILNTGGSMTGGSVKSGGFLSRASEIVSLEGQISAIERETKELEAEIAEKSAGLARISDYADKVGQQQREFEMSHVKLSAELTHINDDLSRFNMDKDVIERDKFVSNGQLDILRLDIEQMEQDIKALEQEIKGIEEVIRQKELAYNNEINSKESINSAITDNKIKYGAVIKDIEMLRQTISATGREIEESRRQIIEKEAFVLQLDQKNSDILAQIEHKRSAITDLEKKAIAIESDISQTTEEKGRCEKDIDVYQNTIKEKRRIISVSQDNQHKTDSKKIKLELELEAIVNRLWEEYELTYNSALEFKRDIGDTQEEIEQAVREIGDLKSQLKRLGDINIAAIDEYKTVKERYDFLAAQQDDLEKAKASLEGIIDEMFRLMESQFSEQFDIISKNFKKVFTELFGGGKAALILTNPADVLQSGIEIEVQPPGKKLQNLMLLSGGERAFTAIAILFAILTVRPTPFCILDEIEAALDDSNVYRFAEYLKKYTDKTQIILITHRRGTMEAADMLYGVTMQEKGVSRLLSINVESLIES